MAVWICQACANDEGEGTELEKENRFPTHTSLGTALGLASGNPVLIALGAAAGALVDSKDRIATELGFQSPCDICGRKDKLESCYRCGKMVCSSCRYLLADRKEESETYLPYRREEGFFESGDRPGLVPSQDTGGIGEGEVEEELDLNTGGEAPEDVGEGEDGWGWGDAEYSTSEGPEGDYSFGDGEGVGEAGEGDGSGEGGSGNGGDGDG